MNYQKLFNNLEKHNKISENDKINIRKYFKSLTVKKKEILISENTLCNKLFFLNDGLLRTFYIDAKGNEITRRIAWESGFLTNMDSFRKNGIDNNETIECIENAELLEISKNNLDLLISTSENLTKVYQIILEKYMAINIRRFQQLTSLNPHERLLYFNKNYPKLKNRISDAVLSTFLGISRKTLERIRKNMIGK